MFTVDINTGRLSILGNAAMNIFEDEAVEASNSKSGVPQSSLVKATDDKNHRNTSKTGSGETDKQASNEKLG